MNFEGLSEEYLPGLWSSKEASVCWRSGREDKVRDLWGADTLGSCRPSTCLGHHSEGLGALGEGGLRLDDLNDFTTGSVGGSWGRQMPTL